MHTERHAEQGRPAERVVAKKRVRVTAPVRGGSSAPYGPAFSTLLLLQTRGGSIFLVCLSLLGPESP